MDARARVALSLLARCTALWPHAWWPPSAAHSAALSYELPTLPFLPPHSRPSPHAAADKTARLWGAYDGKARAVLKGHTGGLSDVAWSPTGSYVGTAGDDLTVRIWDAERVRVARWGWRARARGGLTRGGRRAPPSRNRTPPYPLPAGRRRLQAPARPRQLCALPRLLTPWEPVCVWLL